MAAGITFPRSESTAETPGKTEPSMPGNSQTRTTSRKITTEIFSSLLMGPRF